VVRAGTLCSKVLSSEARFYFAEWFAQDDDERRQADVLVVTALEAAVTLRASMG
jgi:hypothetical protein